MMKNNNPRVEIDTSPPFESVKEAVNLFGGSGSWIPHHLLPIHVDDHHPNAEAIDIDKMEEHTARLERVLISRERETLNILRELEEAKRLVQGLKVKPMQEHGSNSATGMMNLLNLDQASMNLNRTTIDLAVIRASVESLNKKVRKETPPVVYSNNHETYSEIDHKAEIEHSPFKFEAEQFKKMVEASRYEVMKAMSEIEKTKSSIKMAEMRLNAARKIEEAAKAVEAIAYFERDAENSTETLSFEEYNVLHCKAKQTEETCKTKFMDTNDTHKSTQTSLAYKKNSLEEAFDNESDFYRREIVEDSSDYHNMQYSIGDVLNRKLILQDDVVVEKKVEAQSERQQVSLSQMLREQTGLIFRHRKSMKDGSTERQFFTEKKKFGFIHVVLPRHKKKT